MNENSFNKPTATASTSDATQETFEALRQRLRNRFDQLSPHLQRIARSALEKPSDFALNTVVGIAGDLEVQPSTLIRFAKEFGYRGFSEMQRVFRLRLIEGAPRAREEVFARQAAPQRANDYGALLNGCVDALIASLEDLRRSVSPEALDKGTQMLRQAEHVYIAGLRRSRPIATYLAYGLTRCERQCSLLDFGSGMAAEQIATMRSSDLLVAIAFTPYTQSVVDITLDTHLSGKRILVLTDVPESPLARHAELTFLVDNSATSQFRPISGAIALVQTLITGLGTG
ncbi:MurR/RpiR family transcriptional regulator [Bosea sp. NBC_00550]|uniref:MurR/RpiR family transcriptional regulator n=1 Tax=Bosea sp. NBC_00550 TaxID=2969621 RepID=UPI002230E1F2|nr:MurR/RpiR family transcriptional regulator [Bosea sp. NBC_00550]UZF94843.1 MurR/RpiR family transcriptional regulator [Bosea sp. NBC_00550]